MLLICAARQQDTSFLLFWVLKHTYICHRWRYLEARRESAASKRYVLYERALKSLPGSYKVGDCIRNSSCECSAMHYER